MSQPNFPVTSLYAAPLQSYTTVFYRVAYHTCFGGFDKYFTPFFEFDNSGVLAPRLLPELDPLLNYGMNVVPQVLTDTPLRLVSFANTVANLGYNELNLNMGCPHPPVWRKGLGSGLLLTPQKVDAMLSYFFQKLPNALLSVKMRLGVESLHEWEAMMEVLNNYPLVEIIIHPRTAKQLYKGSPNWEIFAEMCVKSTHKVVGNGNLETFDHMTHTHALFPEISGFMIGRGWLKNPWLPQMLKNIPTDEGNMERLKDFHQKFHTLVVGIVNDDNIRRNLLNAFWQYLCIHIDGGPRWYRSLAKERSLHSYPTLVAQLLRRNWLGHQGYLPN